MPMALVQEWNIRPIAARPTTLACGSPKHREDTHEKHCKAYLEHHTAGSVCFFGRRRIRSSSQRTESGTAAAGFGRQAVNGEEQAGACIIFVERTGHDQPKG